EAAKKLLRVAADQRIRHADISICFMQAGFPFIVEFRRDTKLHLAADGPDLAFARKWHIVTNRKEIIARPRLIRGTKIERELAQKAFLNQRRARAELIRLVAVVCVNQRHFDADAPAKHVLVEKCHSGAQARSRAYAFHAEFHTAPLLRLGSCGARANSVDP